MNVSKTILLLLLSSLALTAESPLFQIRKNICYKEGELSIYEQRRCLLDLYRPAYRKNYPTLVWLHGGGLKSGDKNEEKNKAIARALASDGIAVAMVNYRLNPHAKYPAYVEDTASAVCWTLSHIRAQGGDPNQVFLGGHSAGGYLTLMVGMDPTWLKAHGVERNQLAGLIPVSAQTMTHYTVRGERYGSDNPHKITADDAAPVRYASKKWIPPTFIIWAGNDMAARGEENAYLAALLRGAGHTRVATAVIPDRNHSSIAHQIAQPNDPARCAIRDFIRAHRRR